MKRENRTYEIYYDEDGDFLEVSFEEPANEGTTEEIEPGIFVTRDVETKRITDIGILDFKRRVEVLKRVLYQFNIRIPIRISIEDTKR